MLQCAADPVPIGVGYLAQYIVKPLLGYVIAKVCYSACIARGVQAVVHFLCEQFGDLHMPRNHTAA